MAASLSDLLTAMQNGVTAIRALTTTIGTVFPQASALSTSATVGAITFNSSQPAAFLTVLTSSGASVKVAVYNP